MSRYKHYIKIGALLAISCSKSSIVAATPPNIVLINIDDLGWTDMSFQGSEYYQTPNIDKLRSRGVFYSDAYAGAANSAPSRATLITGVYSPRHGVYTVDPADRGKAKDRMFISAENSEVPDPSFTTLAQQLKDGGYATYHLGKWHLGEDATLQGFDVNVGGNMSGHPKTYFSPYKNPNLPDGEVGEFLTDRLASEAIEIIKSSDRSKPFFIYFATYAVHAPLQPKAELLEKYSAIEGSDAHHNAKFAALIDSTDANIGRILDYIDESGLSKNTLIIFTSDNGAVYNTSKQHPLRAGKGSFYEGGIRVPMIISWEGVTATNATIQTPVSQIDLYPTILEVAGIKSSRHELDGRSIASTFGGEECAATPLYWHFPAYLQGGNSETTDPIFRARPLSVIRDGDWKLIYNYESGVKELYNLRDDLSERCDLVKSESARAEELYTKLQSWLKGISAPTEFELNPKYER